MCSELWSLVIIVFYRLTKSPPNQESIGLPLSKASCLTETSVAVLAYACTVARLTNLKPLHHQSIHMDTYTALLSSLVIGPGDHGSVGDRYGHSGGDGGARQERQRARAVEPDMRQVWLLLQPWRRRAGVVVHRRRPHAGTEPAFSCIQCSMLPGPMSSTSMSQDSSSTTMRCFGSWISLTLVIKAHNCELTSL